MLAATKVPKIEEIPGPFLFSSKIDGIRGLVNHGVMYSRKLIPIPNLCLQRWVHQYGQYLQGLDGELVVGPPTGAGVFQTSQSGLTTIEGEPDFSYLVFGNWDNPAKASDRYLATCSQLRLIPRAARTRIKLLNQTLLTTEESKLDYIEKCIELGCEGAMALHPEGLYKYGRSTFKQQWLLKLKRFADSEISITKLVEGNHNLNEAKKDAFGRIKRSSSKAGKVPSEMVGTFIGVDVNESSPFFGKTMEVGPGEIPKYVLEEM